MEGLSWLCVTHEHLDHLDSALFPQLQELAPDVQILVPAPLVALVLESGFDTDKVHGVRPSDTVALGDDARARVLPAFHALTADEPFSDGDTGSGARFVGYALELGSVVVYHSGDTVVTPELRAAARGLEPDIALLPVNGRDFYREEQNLVGNMDAREAVQFAAEIGTRVLVPMHWDMFTANAVRVASVLDEVERAAADLHVVVPTRFRPISLA
jgi:L-ascorbate metabolism protein UlaG (beta-lactamase superfamily)